MNLTQKEYTDPAEKRKDFWFGIVLWVGLNVLVFPICSFLVSIGLSSVTAGLNSNGASNTLFSIVGVVVGFLPLLINIGLIVYFAFTRRQVALGMLAAFGAALLLTLCLGTLFAVACLGIIEAYNGG